MVQIDWNALLQSMLGAAAVPLQQVWPLVSTYASSEFTKYIYDLQMIDRLKDEGKISEEQAKLHLEMQKNSIKAVIAAIEGVGLLAAEAALNAALDVVRQTVNTALGWALV